MKGEIRQIGKRTVFYWLDGFWCDIVDLPYIDSRNDDFGYFHVEYECPDDVIDNIVESKVTMKDSIKRRPMRKADEYRKILESGPRTLREIAAERGITREGCRCVMNKLHRRGFVKKSMKEGKTLWELA